MTNIFLQEDAIVSPLGFTTSENLQAIKEQRSGLKFHENPRSTAGGYFSGIIDPQFLAAEFSEIGNPIHFTKLEQMMLLAAHRVIQDNPQINLEKTVLIVSSTKGNIDLLDNPQNFPEDRISLNSLANVIQSFFGFKKQPIIVSNACISGGLAVTIAKRFIQAGKFSSALVVAGDLVSDFVISGFQSFQALSKAPCKPFSKSRDGINLGEAAAAIVTGLILGVILALAGVAIAIESLNGFGVTHHHDLGLAETVSDECIHLEQGCSSVLMAHYVDQPIDAFNVGLAKEFLEQVGYTLRVL